MWLLAFLFIGVGTAAAEKAVNSDWIVGWLAGTIAFAIPFGLLATPILLLEHSNGQVPPVLLVYLLTVIAGGVLAGGLTAMSNGFALLVGIGGTVLSLMIGGQHAVYGLREFGLGHPSYEMLARTMRDLPMAMILGTFVGSALHIRHRERTKARKPPEIGREDEPLLLGLSLAPLFVFAGFATANTQRMPPWMFDGSTAWGSAGILALAIAAAALTFRYVLWRIMEEWT